VIDFSESSEKALKWAAGMAVKLNSHLTVVHPYRLNQLKKKEDMLLVKKNIDEDALKNFEKISRDIFGGELLSYDFYVEVGFIPDRVQEHSRRNELLFMVLSKKLASNDEILAELIEQSKVPLVICT
jgi:Universal stress protein family